MNKAGNSKITDMQIKAWIKNKEHFEFKKIETNLFLTFPPRFNIPTFKFRYRMGPGKKREIISMGSYSKISLADARKYAKQYNGQIANGTSPKLNLEARKSAESRENEVFTVEKLADDYYKERVLTRLKNPTNAISPLKRLKAAIGKIPIAEVTGKHIKDMYKKDLKRDFPASTNALQKETIRVFTYAVALDLIPYNPAQLLDVSYAGGTQEQRDRNLDETELNKLFTDMATAKGFGRVNYLTIKLVLLLCIRKCELTQAQKTEFDLANSTWSLTKQRTKKTIAIVIPLPRQAVKALSELFEASGDSSYLLPARKSRNRNLPHISDGTINSALKKITQVTNFTVHDLRRTAKTKLQELGVDEFVSERCLNHRIYGVAGIYGNHDFFKERKEALQKWADYLESRESNNLEDGTNAM